MNFWMKRFGWKIGVQLVLPIVSTIWRKIKIRECVIWPLHVEFLLHLNKLLVCLDLAYNHCRSGVKPVLFSWIFAHVNLHCSLLLILFLQLKTSSIPHSGNLSSVSGTEDWYPTGNSTSVLGLSDTSYNATLFTPQNAKVLVAEALFHCFITSWSMWKGSACSMQHLKRGKDGTMRFSSRNK